MSKEAPTPEELKDMERLDGYDPEDVAPIEEVDYGDL